MSAAAIISKVRRLQRVKAERLAPLKPKAVSREEAREAAQASGRSAPIFPEYANDPCGYTRDVLGVRLWRDQRRILESIAESRRVAVSSGQKNGKSSSFVCAALWWAGTRRRGRVMLTAPTNPQVDTVLWTELKRIVYDPDNLRADGKRVADVLGVEPAMKPQTGMQWPDGREIIGRVSDSPAATQGFSGPEVLIIADEGSGIPDPIFEAHEGNTAGGGRILTASNPVINHGWFFRAFHSEAQHWTRLTLSSEDTPNITGAEEPIPGLADREFIESTAAKYGGRESPFYKVRVLGEFADSLGQ